MATVKDQQPKGQPPPKRQKGGKSNWQQAFSYEKTLDGPCKFHSGAKPSNHTTQKCHWLTRIAKGDDLLPPHLLGSRLLLRPSSLRLLPLELVLDFPEEERMMQQSRVSISLSF